MWLRVKVLLLGVIFLALVLAAVSIIFPRGPLRHAACGNNLSESARQELEAYLATKTAVLTSMPSHPSSDEVLQKVEEIYCRNLRISRQDAQKLVAEQFRQSPLGLYALNRYLSDQMDERSDKTEAASAKLGYCKYLCEIYPDARISLMAFDHLWEAAPDRLGTCDQYIRKGLDSKLGVFALVRKGDGCVDAGLDAEAALCYLKAWQKEPARGKKLYSALCSIWLPRGDWVYPAMISDRYVETPALDFVKTRAVAEIQTICDACSHNPTAAPARLWNASANEEPLQELLNDERAPVYWRTKAALILAKSLLEIGRTTEASEILRKTQRLLSEKEQVPSDCVHLCLAAFLLSGDAGRSQVRPESPGVFLKVLAGQSDLAQTREAFLRLAEGALRLTPPDEQAYYAFLVAQRYLDGSDIKKALETLKAASQIEGTSLRLKQDAVLEEARIYAEEWHAYYQAGKLCAEFCSKLAKEGVPEDVRYKAGMYYFRAQAYDDALVQFQNLFSDDQNERTKTASEFMVGLCHLQKGNSEVAIQSFRDFAARYPDSDLSSRALYLEGMCHLSSQRYDDALACFHNLIARYPESEYAKRAKEYVTRLANLGDKK